MNESSLDPVNMEVIEDLISLSPTGGAEILQEIVEAFIKSGQQRVQKLTQAAATQDAKVLAFEAHSFKSSSGNVGSLKIPSLCIELEKKAGQGQLANASQLTNQIQIEFEALKTALLQILKDRSK